LPIFSFVLVSFLGLLNFVELGCFFFFAMLLLYHT